MWLSHSRRDRAGCRARSLMTALPPPPQEAKGCLGSRRQIASRRKGVNVLWRCGGRDKGLMDACGSCPAISSSVKPCVTHIFQWPEGLTSDSVSHGLQVGERSFEPPLHPAPPHRIPPTVRLPVPTELGGRRAPALSHRPLVPGAAAPSCLRAGDVSPTQLIMWKIGRNCTSLSGKRGQG